VKPREVKTKTKGGAADLAAASEQARAVKLSVNVSAEVGWRLRKIAFEERLSESSIVEIALEELFARTTETTVGKFLRERGASLRRGGA
jgi:hypothetical protein